MTFHTVTVADSTKTVILSEITETTITFIPSLNRKKSNKMLQSYIRRPSKYNCNKNKTLMTKDKGKVHTKSKSPHSDSTTFKETLLIYSKVTATTKMTFSTTLLNEQKDSKQKVNQNPNKKCQSYNLRRKQSSIRNSTATL